MSGERTIWVVAQRYMSAVVEGLLQYNGQGVTWRRTPQAAIEIVSRMIAADPHNRFVVLYLDVADEIPFDDDAAITAWIFDGDFDPFAN